MSAQGNLTEVRQDVASQTPLRQPAPEAVEPITSPAVSGRARIEQNKKHLFGLEQDVPRPEPVFQDDYEMRLPEDPYGEETKPNARVWRVYVEEAASFDGIMVGQYRDGLDVMLVFAGLFSAVVTSFLVQVSQNLQADYAQMSALLLHDLVSIQLSDGAVANITTPSIDPAQKFRPDALDVWINGLWAASLTAALVVALVSVLVKQWLHHYISLPSGTPLDRSHVRQFRFMGLERWRVRIIIGMLPLIMHVSLMLFLAGLVLFYIPLRVSLAWTIGIGAVVVCILYLVSNAMPLLFPQCPYQTPLTDFLHNTWQLSTTACYTLQKQVMPFVSRWLESDYSQAVTAVKSLKTTEAEAVQRAHHTLYVDSLDWLFRMSSNPSVHSIVIQAIGGLPFDSIPHAKTVWRESSFLQMARSESIFDSTVDDVEHEYKRKYLPGAEHRLERLFRSFIVIPLRQAYVPVHHPSLHHPSLHNTRLRAVLWIGHEQLSARGPAPEQDEMPEDFLLLNAGTAMHPLVWRNMVFIAARYGFLRLTESPSPSYARLLSLLLPEGPEPVTPDIVLPTYWANPLNMPLKDVVNGKYLRPVMWNYFVLNIRGDYISDDGNSSCLTSEQKALLVLGNLAIRHIDTELSSSAQDWPFLNLLEQVVRQLPNHLSEQHVDRAASATMLSKHHDLENLLRAATDKITVHRRDLPDELRRCLDRCFQYFMFIYCSISPGSAPPNLCHYQMLHRQIARIHRQIARNVLHNSAVEPTIGGMPFFFFFDNVLHRVVKTEFASALTRRSRSISFETSATSAMSTALSRGFEPAFRLCVDVDWIGRLCLAWLVESIPFPNQFYPVIPCYVSGLSLLQEYTQREFLAHLYEPRNLTLAFLTLSSEVTEVTRLVELHTTHPSWQECRLILKALHTWVQSPTREPAEFPLKTVGNDWGVQSASGATVDSGADVLRECFNDERTGEWLSHWRSWMKRCR